MSPGSPFISGSMTATTTLHSSPAHGHWYSQEVLLAFPVVIKVHTFKNLVLEQAEFSRHMFIVYKKSKWSCIGKLPQKKERNESNY